MHVHLYMIYIYIYILYIGQALLRKRARRASDRAAHVLNVCEHRLDHLKENTIYGKRTHSTHVLNLSKHRLDHLKGFRVQDVGFRLRPQC